MLIILNKLYKDKQSKTQNNNCKKTSSFSLNKNCGNYSVRTFSLKTIFVPKKRIKLRKRLKRIGRKWLRLKKKQRRRLWKILYKKRIKRVSVFVRRRKKHNNKVTRFVQASGRNRKIIPKKVKLDWSTSLLRSYTPKFGGPSRVLKKMLSLHIRSKAVKRKNLIKSSKLKRKYTRRLWRKLYSRPWQYRFPRWRGIRRYYKTRKFSTGRWGSHDLLSYKSYTLPHQPYRNRKPWQQKKNRWSSQYRYVNKGGIVLSRKQRLLKRQIIYQLYKRYYSIPNRKYITHKNLTFRKSGSYFLPPKILKFNLFENRLDVSLYRMNLAPSLKIAQSLIEAGFVYVNNVQVTNTRYSIGTWDLISITPDSYVHYMRYWYIRNKYKRYLLKNKGSRVSSVSQERLTYAFGFKTRLLNEYAVSRLDRIKLKEVERLFLWK